MTYLAILALVVVAALLFQARGVIGVPNVGVPDVRGRETRRFNEGFVFLRVASTSSRIRANFVSLRSRMI